MTNYQHKENIWVLGLPASVTTNGRNMAGYSYDGLGRKISETRYGALFASYAYNSDGTMQWAQDALARRTNAYNWKRGTPQRIRRADNRSVYQYVDDNGWLSYSIDARSYRTDYERDIMGRLTEFTPVAPWTPTSISYNFAGGGDANHHAGAKPIYYQL